MYFEFKTIIQFSKDATSLTDERSSNIHRHCLHLSYSLMSVKTSTRIHLGGPLRMVETCTGIPLLRPTADPGPWPCCSPGVGAGGAGQQKSKGETVPASEWHTIQPEGMAPALCLCDRVHCGPQVALPTYPQEEGAPENRHRKLLDIHSSLAH